MLNNDQSACHSHKKVSPLCENCKRNLSQFEASSHELWSYFEPKEVKNFKTNVHFKCVGFIEKRK